MPMTSMILIYENEEENLFRTNIEQGNLHLSCFVHLIQRVLVLIERTRGIKSDIMAAKNLISKFNHSGKRNEMLLESASLTLIRNRPTRLYTIYLLLKRLIQLKSTIISICV